MFDPIGGAVPKTQGNQSRSKDGVAASSNGSDTIYVRGEPLPGIARIVGLTRKAKIDEQMAPGLGGAYLLYRGRNLARWQIEIVLGFVPLDYESWCYKWLPVLRFPKGPVSPQGAQIVATVAFDIEHPILADIGVKQFALEEIKGPDAMEHGNISKVVLSCVEFLNRPRIQQAKIEAPEATPEDPADKQVREATREFADAAARVARAYKAPP